MLGSSVICIIPRVCLENSAQQWIWETQSGNQWRFSANLKDGWLVLNNENVRYMHLGQLCRQSFGLGVGLFTKSRNNTLYQCRENRFHGEKLIAWGKILFLGKICWGEYADNWRHFLSKKKPWTHIIQFVTIHLCFLFKTMATNFQFITRVYVNFDVLK